MGDDAERRDGVHQPLPVVRQALQQIDDRRKARENQEQASHHRNNEAHHLAARDGHAAIAQCDVGQGMALTCKTRSFVIERASILRPGNFYPLHKNDTLLLI